MAHLEVQPRKKSSMWIWLIIGLLIVAVILFFLMRSNNKDQSVIATTDTIASTSKPIVAADPDWNNVNFNAPDTQYEEVTGKGIVVRSNDQYTIYSLGENILFATDKSTLEGDADSQLKQIAASLNKRFPHAQIGVYGHADAKGTSDHNSQLAAERAAAVKIWLIQHGDVAENKISVHSLGETKPLADNNNAAGRQQNRSVEIVAFPGK
ncbi:OmpA family protein [Chitinophaga sp. RAB17]|uniref:OmpA family protein n=1 Tax=Chitinophaga sp. RAB17 TaxID=3233049 RepID=UPI003F9388ED